MMRDFDDIDLDAEEDYEIRQRSRDEDYRKAYGEWVASLPPEERERLGELGLDRASVPGAGTGAPSRDLAESSMACCEPEEIVEAEPQPSTTPSLDEPDPERLHDLLRRLVGELIGQDNARQDRPGAELKRVVAAVVHADAGYVGRQQIGRKLDALEVGPQRPRQRLGQRRLADAGNIFQ